MSSPPHNGVSVFTQPAASLRRFALNSGLVAAGASAVPEPHAAKPEDAEAAAAVVAAKRAVRQEALRKYREKRKTRTFNKKVRYESRKRVALSRPRVLGRFVKVTDEAGSGGGTSSSGE